MIWVEKRYEQVCVWGGGGVGGGIVGVWSVKTRVWIFPLRSQVGAVKRRASLEM